MTECKARLSPKLGATSITRKDARAADLLDRGLVVGDWRRTRLRAASQRCWRMRLSVVPVVIVPGIAVVIAPGIVGIE